jgi:hypothetical protein
VANIKEREQRESRESKEKERVGKERKIAP